MPPRPASIKVRALQWLAQREHSRDELRGKLLRLLQRPPARPHDHEDRGETDVDHRPSPALGHPSTDPATDPPTDPATDPAAEVDKLLLWLEAHGHLSQTRFVESRVHARQSRFGNLRIRQELQQHGVRLDAATQQALQLSEFDRAREVWRKKYGSLAVDATARVRQMRFLAGRGFSLEVVRRVVLARPVSDSEIDTDEVDNPAS